MAEKKQRQPKSTSKRSTGKVSRFVDFKGFGFIKPDDGGEDIFVHQSSIKSDGYRTLFAGESVEFTLAIGNNGKIQAVDVVSTIKKNNNRRCYNCGDVNHLARDCEKGESSSSYNRNSSGDGKCYKCGEPGHYARDCEKGESSGSSYRNNSGDGKCYECGESGHYARDCTSNTSKYSGGDVECYNCGGIGHISRDCKSGRKGGDGKCYKCGRVGHFARECLNGEVSA